MEGVWDVALVAALIGVYSLLAALVYHLATTGDDTDDEEPDQHRTGTVTCRQCGCENGPEYRFCRSCVADLSPLSGL